MLSELRTRDECLARTVEFRFFAGLSEEGTAQGLGVRFARRAELELRARAWIRAELSPGQDSTAGQPDLTRVASAVDDASGVFLATLAPIEKRGLDRLRPRGVVSLSIYQGEGIPPAYAIVSDISERGARVHSDRILFKGQNLQLCIRFEAERDLFETSGRVAWARPSVGEERLYGGGLSDRRL